MTSLGQSFQTINNTDARTFILGLEASSKEQLSLGNMTIEITEVDIYTGAKASQVINLQVEDLVLNSTFSVNVT